MKTGIKKVLACVLALGMLAGCSAKTETYTGTGKGFGGDVTVTITVDSNGKITAVESTGEKETEAVGGAALEKLDANFLAAQSAEFDGVAQATVTSDAYKEAVADALAQMNGGKVEEDGSSKVEEESSKAEEESSKAEEESSSVEEDSSKAE